MDTTCVHYQWEKDCEKCMIHGYVSICGSCKDYKDGRQPEVIEEEERTFREFGGFRC